MAMSNYVLRAKEVCKTFSGVYALNKVNIDIRQGEVHCLAGENGCGKSTLINIISGVYTRDSGEIELNGKVYKKITPAEAIEEGVQVIYQDFAVFPNLTVKENLSISTMVSSHKKIMNWKESEKIAQKAMEMIGVELDMDQEVGEISVADKQLVAICRALINDAKLLIMDEPTTALDVTIQAQIIDLMNHLKKEIGTSIMFITHDLGVVAETCDEVVVMYCGRVVERGDVKTIFANPSHPYTKGLLGSIPRLGDAGKELKSIPGNVPNPKYMPKGCKFEPRCPYASEKCREEEPGFFQIEEGHISRCWLCESGQLKTDHVEKAGD